MEVKSKIITKTGKLVLNSNSSINFVDINEIILCKKLKEFIIFIMNDRPTLNLEFPFEQLCDLLKDESFIQTDEKHLINLKYLENISEGEGNCIVMSQNTTVPVNIERKKIIIDALEAFHKIN